MKKLLGIIIILAILILGGYYGMGMATEKTLKRDVDIINQSNNVFVNVKSYHRGWFTSQAQVHWRLHVPERVVKNAEGQSTTVPAQDYDLDMPLTIYHGPIIFTPGNVHFGFGYAYTDLELPPAYVEQFTKSFSAQSTQPKLHVSVLVNYLNKSHFKAKMPKFKLIAKEANEGEFEWYGMENDVVISSNLNSIHGGFKIDGMNFNKDKVKAEVGAISSHYNFHRELGTLYLGNMDFTVPSVVVTENQAKIFDMEKFEVNSGADLKSDLVDYYFDSSVDKVSVQNKSYGPGKLKLGIKNIDGPVLAQINQQINQMQQGNEQEQRQALIGLLPQVPKLLSKGPVFEISELSLVMPEGNIQGNLQISLPAGETTNPFQIIQKMTGDGKLQVPVVVLNRIIKESWKQQLSKVNNNNALPQAMASEMQKNQASDAKAQGDTKTAPATTTVTTTSTPSTTATSVSTTGDLDQRAQTQADHTIENFLQAGLLVKEGENYTIHVQLANAQLTVNGNPFDPSTFKFQ